MLGPGNISVHVQHPSSSTPKIPNNNNLILSYLKGKRAERAFQAPFVAPKDNLGVLPYLKTNTMIKYCCCGPNVLLEWGHIWTIPWCSCSGTSSWSILGSEELRLCMFGRVRNVHYNLAINARFMVLKSFNPKPCYSFGWHNCPHDTR